MNKNLKERGEDAAAAFLERVGIHVLERDWRCDAGAIDIVAMDGETLVIVVVKTRQSGHQEESQTVSAATGRRLKKLAKAYIEHTDLGVIGWRVDRIDLLVISDDRALLRHHRALLTPTD